MSDEILNADLTGQQRAARVTAAIYKSRIIHIRDVMRLTGLSRRAAHDMLEMISAAIPILPIGDGRWQLIDPEVSSRRSRPASSAAQRPMFKIHPNTRAMIAFWLAHSGQLQTQSIAREMGLTTPEVRWLLQRLRCGGLPIDEIGGDTWQVRKDK